jgi:hypothetical protein
MRLWSVRSLFGFVAVALVGCAQGSTLEGDSGEDEAFQPHLVRPAPAGVSPGALAAPKPSTSSGKPLTAYPPGAVATFDPLSSSPDHTGVRIYAPRPSDNATPLAILEVPSAPGSIAGLAFDRKGRLYAVDYTGRIQVFASGASGLASPVQVVNPDGLFPKTGPSYAYGIALDSTGQMYVNVNTELDVPGPESILVYAPDASGAAAPLREIAGPKTGFGMPIRIALDELDHLYVGDMLASTVSVFGTDADGDVAPLRTALIPGGVGAMTVAPDGRFFVAPEGTPGWSVREYAPLTGGAPKLLGVLAGPDTGLDPVGSAPLAMALDPWGELELISPSKGFRFAKGAVGNVAPKGFFYGWNALAVAPRVSD